MTIVRLGAVPLSKSSIDGVARLPIVGPRVSPKVLPRHAHGAQNVLRCGPDREMEDRLWAEVLRFCPVPGFGHKGGERRIGDGRSVDAECVKADFMDGRFAVRRVSLGKGITHRKRADRNLNVIVSKTMRGDAWRPGWLGSRERRWRWWSRNVPGRIRAFWAAAGRHSSSMAEARS